ncbi:hypothetical protein GHT06_012772 [Daphnia sinensis]|uniref:protein-tyrosine-phosphatase n=1 Tax=Daphnia sinensis TaxID=1820382 RepID=A0AAD5PW07_9CRUS|nr:hypothetical protein GHT06_012772 [Daphnia sinensis]
MTNISNLVVSCLHAAVIFLMLAQQVSTASLSVRFPDEVASLALVPPGAGHYRLDFWPAQGVPPPNNTLLPTELLQPIELRGVQPGTNYHFRLLFWNATLNAWPAWTLTLPTAPEPPSNLVIRVRKAVQVTWDPPSVGGVTGYKIKLHALSEPLTGIRTFVLSADASPFPLRELTPGASYRLELHSMFENRDSEVAIVQNFTTRPNTPGRFIVWFRNETTLLVLWQPPYPAGIYSNYKVSIDPPDAVESTLEVEKVGEPPGPAQAPFYGLLPGRNYNISVQTVSNGEISLPTTAQYRTVPLRPRNVTFERRLVTSDSFQIRWEEPKGMSEFDRYHVSVGTGRPPIIVRRDEPRMALFNEGLEPGRTYPVLVKTLSGNVASWPATANVTTRPLTVQNLTASLPSPGTEGVTSVSDLVLAWSPDVRSQQDAYRVAYQEVAEVEGNPPSAGDVTALNAADTSGVLVTSATQLVMTSLLPGRNYSLSVIALMAGMESESVAVYQATRPSSPIIEELTPVPNGLNVSWKSDVTSKQDRYTVVYIRNDTGDPKTREVTEPRILLENLYPGASYQIRVFAVSHGLWSEPNTHFQAVYPRSPRNFSVAATSSSSLRLTWSAPVDSIYTNYVIRYRTADNVSWTELSSVVSTDTELKQLTAGERYVLLINSASHRVESAAPIELQYTLYPNPVARLTPLVDATNVTLSWERPPGRVDMYRLVWYQAESDPILPSLSLQDDRRKRQTDQPQKRSVVVNGDSNHSYIDTLFPGTLYVIEMTSISFGVESNKTLLTLRTLPLITSDIVIVKRHETNSLTLSYTPTPSSISRFNSYRFSLTDSTKKTNVKEKTVDDPDRKVIFDDLVPGRLYEISAWTVSGGVTSHPVLRQVRLYPEPASAISARDISDTELTLSWKAPQGDWNSFELKYLDYNNLLVAESTKQTFITITNLRPHRNYTFTVYTRSGDNGSAWNSISLPMSASFSTRESVPEKVPTFRPVEIQPSQIRFEWTLPSHDQNGVLIGFTVSYGILGSTSTVTREFPPGSSSGTISGLFPGKTYLFRIQAKTKIGSGNSTKWEQVMPIWAPPKPGKKDVPEILAKTTTTVKLQFKKGLFSDENGQVIGYTIIASEDENKDITALETPLLLRWKDVQSYNVWPPYQVVEQYNPFTNSTTEVFTVGSETCESRIQLTGYCNGPLKPGTAYKFKIRAFTAKDKYNDTLYSAPVITDPDNSTVIAGVTIPVILLLCGAATVIVMRRKGRRNGSAASGCLGKVQHGNHRGPDGLSLSDGLETTRPVKLKDFADHYRRMAADSDFRFSEEFDCLKHVGRDQPCVAADLPVNRPKNRFTNILPYDHSRFKLLPTDDEEGSDYINANYVPGFNSPREFIVTQGPLHSTRDDFWRMTWESGTRAIIMLTRCVEKGREKCDRYWPFDTQPVYYGDIQVTILNESHYADWSISEFRVCRGESSRIIRHFHFNTWPDFGVPDPPTTLIRFVRSFRDRVSTDAHKPIVVHCSAGVGRSGTFIALDRLIQQMQCQDHIDVFGVVQEMRRERVWMVQTEQQYICIHQCILAVLQGFEYVDTNGVNGTIGSNGAASVGHPSMGMIGGILTREMHDNQGFEDDEGIAESGM